MLGRRGDYGDGPSCPANPEHGHMFRLGDSLYCPHSDHTKTRSENRQSLYEGDGKTPGGRRSATK